MRGQCATRVLSTYYPLATHSLPTHYPFTTHSIHPLSLTTRSLPTHSDSLTATLADEARWQSEALANPDSTPTPTLTPCPTPNQARWQAEALADEADVAAARAELDAEVDSPPG